MGYVISLPLVVACSGGDLLLLRTGIATCAGALLLPILRRDLLRQGPGAARMLHWDAAGAFHLDLAGGRRLPVRLAHGSFGTTAFLWLVFRGAGRYAVFVDRSAADPRAYAALLRRLRRPASGGEAMR